MTRHWTPDNRLRRDHARIDSARNTIGFTLGDQLSEVGPPILTTTAQDRAAALALAGNAAGVDELREWLAMLGLTPERCRG